MSVSDKLHLVVHVHCISANSRVHCVGPDDGCVSAADCDYFILGMRIKSSLQALPTCVQVNSRMIRTSTCYRLSPLPTARIIHFLSSTGTLTKSRVQGLFAKCCTLFAAPVRSTEQPHKDRKTGRISEQDLIVGTVAVLREQEDACGENREARKVTYK
jgi:hypothetical protein